MPVSPSGGGSASPTQATRGWHELTHTLAYELPKTLHRSRRIRHGIRQLAPRARRR